MELTIHRHLKHDQDTAGLLFGRDHSPKRLGDYNMLLMKIVLYILPNTILFFNI